MAPTVALPLSEVPDATAVKLATMAPKADHRRSVRAGDSLRVVGGGGRGGILVREAQAVSSPETAERLTTGSVVNVAEVAGGRVRYELTFGTGPSSGWISLKAGDKVLLVPAAEKEADSDTDSTREGSEPAADASGPAAAVLSLYAKRMAEERNAAGEGDAPGFNRTHFPLWGAGAGTRGKPEHAVRAELDWDLKEQGPDAEEDGADSDGEMFAVCASCKLPLGRLSYAHEGEADGARRGRGHGLMHGECRAAHLVRELRAKEEERVKEQADCKRGRRAEFEIGWEAGKIPTGIEVASGVSCGFEPKGMVCLQQVRGGSVRLLPTTEPASSVNLTYLSTALRVRRTEGVEPMFSLDPIKAEKKSCKGEEDKNAVEESMQEKVFDPEWLAGTEVGDVMFQADYNLKELSMGEHTQPVVGMRSCMELDDATSREPWNGREWFVVRKAEMQISEDGVLVPFLKMGVEAREQVDGPRGLEDAPSTRSGHPLVRYAESFTRNFDLIAERRGVVFQLREVAKASILAKYLVESGAQLSEAWFAPPSGGQPACCLEVPQLWNDRHFARISVEDGKIEQTGGEGDGACGTRGLYGGVDFGIDRFRLSAPGRTAASVLAASRQTLAVGRPMHASSLMGVSTPGGLSVGPGRQFSRLVAPLRPSMATAPMGGPGRVMAPLSQMSLAAPLRSASFQPQGVDLSLEKFNLSAATAAAVPSGADAGANVAVGSAFWAEVEADGSCKGGVFSAEDKALFRSVYNPYLSDRREEGDAFIPPPSCYLHVQSLKRLVKDEELLRRRRVELFSSVRFDANDLAPEFPPTWSSGLRVARDAKRGTQLVERPEYKTQSVQLAPVLQATAPEFDHTCEAGMRFRVYSAGSLEIRTTQAHGGTEEVLVVFSLGSPSAPFGAAGRAAPQHQQRPLEEERLTKATEYVQRTSQLGRQSFVVLETARGRVLTEQHPDGSLSWMDNVADLDLRSSLSKVIRTHEGGDVTLGDVKWYHVLQGKAVGRGPASRSARKAYSHGIFGQATGGTVSGSGFQRRSCALPVSRGIPPRYQRFG